MKPVFRKLALYMQNHSASFRGQCAQSYFILNPPRRTNSGMACSVFQTILTTKKNKKAFRHHEIAMGN